MCVQARLQPHAKGSQSWAKQMSKIASMLASAGGHAGPKSHINVTDHTDISACESLLENYFLLVGMPAHLVARPAAAAAAAC